MTTERWLYLRVGLLLVGGLALGLAMLWFIGGQRIGQAERFESYFSESVQGLEVGAPVKYRGVTLGHVTEIGLVSAAYGATAQLDAATYRLVFVRYLIDRRKLGTGRDLDAAVRLGLRVRLASQGLTGMSYLELDFVSPQAYPPLQVPWTPAMTIIPSIPSTLSQVQNAAQQVLAKLNGVDIDALVTGLSKLVEELRGQFTQGDADRALREITSLARTMQQAVNAADLPGLTAELRQSAAALHALAQDRALHGTLDGAEQATTAMAQAARQLPGLIASLQAAARRAGDSTADLQQALVPLLRDMRATMQNLRDASEQLRRYPGQILSGPPPRSQGQVR